jgi:predicted O-methyltransferase YrrM
MKDWIEKLFESRDLTRMGHLQRVEDANLGLGWIYYALARVIRPKQVVVIGSYRGFVPLVLGKALADNGDGGEVIFIDPSLVDDFWKDSNAVADYFARFDIGNISHHLMTTQQFVRSATYRALRNVGMVFVDGYHSEEQARFDYDAFASLLDENGIILLHDTSHCGVSGMYGPEAAYQCRVKFVVDELKKDTGLQVFDLPFGQGVTLIRKLSATARSAEDAPGCIAISVSNAQP